jgi:hypothetical protein
MTRTNKEYARDKLHARKNRVVGAVKGVLKRGLDDKKVSSNKKMGFY